MRNLIIFILLCVAWDILIASPATEASTELKGFFGESLADDIYQAAGRELVPYKINPNIPGPDKIYRLPDGIIEVHEVKAYSGWAGRSAMQTTAGNIETYELSSRWCQHWINETLKKSSASASEKQAARVLAEAIKTKKVRFIYDEFNLVTQQLRSSNVIQVGLDGVELAEKIGPTNLKRFEQFFSRKSKDFLQMKLGNLDRVMNSPRVAAWQPLSRQDQLKLLPQDVCADSQVRKIEIRNGLITADGSRLLISVKAGAIAGMMVFAADAGHAIYNYIGGNILKPELQREIANAAVKGTFVGACVGVTVFLGATPGGWVVLAVSVGSYMVVDTAVKIWHEHHNRKYLTIDDLRGWGIYLDTPLAPNEPSILAPQPDTPLNPELDTILF